MIKALSCLLWLMPLLAATASPGDGADRQPAVSREVLESAQQHYRRGVSSYEAGRYATARDEFEEAYRLAHLPDLLINLAAASESLNDLEAAIRHLVSYLRIRPDAQDRDEVRAQIERLSKKLPQKDTPPPTEVQPPPAAPRVSDRSKAAAASQPLKRARRIPPWPALLLVGIGGAVVVAGIGTGSAALVAARTVESGARFDPDLFHRGQALDTAAIACDVIGGLALAAGLTWTTIWYLRRGRDHGPVRAAFVPAGTGLSVRY